jgi:hypothetical protein
MDPCPEPTALDMNTSNRSIWFWCLLAALAGPACFALSALLFPGSENQPFYGQPLIHWFAWLVAHVRFLPTLISFLIAGVVLGAAQPRHWRLLSASTLALPFLLHLINVVHDIMLDPTSHNLWPFEFVMLAIIEFPAVPGAFVGSSIRNRFDGARSVDSGAQAIPPPLPKV